MPDILVVLKFLIEVHFLDWVVPFILLIGICAVLIWTPNEKINLRYVLGLIGVAVVAMLLNKELTATGPGDIVKEFQLYNQTQGEEKW